MTRQTVTIHGTRFVMVEETRLRQLEALARKVEPQLPLLPPADARKSPVRWNTFARRSPETSSKSGAHWV